MRIFMVLMGTIWLIVYFITKDKAYLILSQMWVMGSMLLNA